MTRSKTRPALATIPAIGRRAAIAGAGSLLAFPAIHARAQTSGVALVIGNSKYQWESSLPNVKRDVPDVAKRFQSLGLKTELVQDLTKDAMIQLLAKYKSAAADATFVAVYFAGHGVNWANLTYVVPVDADLSVSKTDALVRVQAIYRAFPKSANRLMVFDSCRNNPADGWRQQQAQDHSLFRTNQQQKIAAEDPERLTLYSTAPGRTALDGPAGQNSPFAAAFLRQLSGASTDLHALPELLRRDLLLATQGRQLLFAYNHFTKPVRISGPRDPAFAASGPAYNPASIVELSKAYAFARDSGFDLPPGMIAIRPAAGSPDGKKIGTFKYIDRSNNTSGNASLLIVLSVDETRTAQLVLAGKSNNGAYWRFVSGTVSGDRLEYLPHGAGSRYIFDWRDANGGSVGALPENAVSSKPYSTDFTRLDG